jgi:hypothetical protein
LDDLLRGLAAGRGHAILAMLFALPFLVPVPLVGLSSILGSTIILLGLTLALGKSLWLPRPLRYHECPPETWGKAFSKGAHIVGKLERWIRPRGRWLARSAWVTPANGLAIAWGGGLLALPLPNFLPGLGVVLLALGVLEDDGLFVILGYLVTLFTTALYTAVAFLGFEGVTRLLALW